MFANSGLGRVRLLSVSKNQKEPPRSPSASHDGADRCEDIRSAVGLGTRAIGRAGLSVASRLIRAFSTCNHLGGELLLTNSN